VKRLREHIVQPIGPAPVVLDNLVMKLRHELLPDRCQTDRLTDSVAKAAVPPSPTCASAAD
jgi:hypothetical protein